MGISLTATGNTVTDVNAVIRELNRLNNNTNNINLLNIVAYGQMSITVPDQKFGIFTSSFKHGLGYKPVFLVYERFTGSGPFQPQTQNAQLGPYFSEYYISGPKATGAYFFSWDFAYVDSQNLYINYEVISNTGPFYAPGTYDYSYFIFSYPIT